jgi:hypothetical protein
MSERENYMTESRGAMLRGWVLAQMMRGAGLAAVVVLAVAVVIWAIYGIGLLLPEGSRETPAPMGAIDVPVLSDLA